MSSPSCLAHPRVRLPPPSSAAAANAVRPSCGLGPRRAAPAKVWRLVAVSCFRQDLDEPSTSENDGSYKYIAQPGSSRGEEVKEEEVESSKGGQERNSEEEGWLVQVQKFLPLAADEIKGPFGRASGTAYPKRLLGGKSRIAG
ncbi:hypothetical protein ACP70R_043119 [Stipagrostis hirtigluma subsp. patula]